MRRMKLVMMIRKAVNAVYSTKGPKKQKVKVSPYTHICRQKKTQGNEKKIKGYATGTTRKRIDDEPAHEAADDTDDRRERDRTRALAEGDAADEHDGLEALAQHGDEREQEQDPAARTAAALVRRARLVEGAGELDGPLCARAVELEHGDAHDEDDERGDEREDALPELLGLGPQVGRLCEPDGDEGGADGERDEEPGERAEEDLFVVGEHEEGNGGKERTWILSRRINLRASTSRRPSASSLAPSELPSSVLRSSGTSPGAATAAAAALSSAFCFSFARYAACSGWLGCRQSVMKMPASVCVCEFSSGLA